MNHWTPTARDLLDEYLKQHRATIAESGADPDEVEADLRRHITVELAARQLATVTAEDVRQVLQKMGPPESPPIAVGIKDSSPPQPQLAESSAAPKRPSRHIILFLLGVLLPALTLLIEAVTHMCGGVFFDPIPTVWHGLLVGLVPVANFALWRLTQSPNLPRPEWRIAGGGCAAALSGAYAILFVPLMIPAFFALIVFGWGFLPLSPSLSLLATCLLLRSAWKNVGARANRSAPWLWGGVMVGFLGLGLVNSPQWLTNYWASRVIRAETPDQAWTALRNLRVFGHEDTLLQACYRGIAGFRGVNGRGWEMNRQPIDPDSARRIYFQVTGRPFNSVPPPQLKYGAARWQFLEEWEWDEGHGGTAVAGRIKGLSLQQSRVDGLLQPDAGWSYVEWILEFRNVGKLAREARAQIALPPGGVVSRLTLWVNGEEREAAFAGSAKTRKAYEEVAVVQRRDPVLVTSAGQDRVLMQCFPVPANGGTMKVRIGITAPWILSDPQEAALRLPRFLERNFSIPEGISHSVWLESKQSLQAASSFKNDYSKPGVTALRGEIPDSDLAGEQGVIRARRTEETPPAWAAYDGEDGTTMIRQMPDRVAQKPITRVMVVIDGAVGMESILGEIGDALAQVPTGLEVGIILARDGVREIFEPRRWSVAARPELAERVRGLRVVGGQDNQESLLAGWDKATEATHGAVIWIHGSQPVAFDRLEKLSQRLLWNPQARPLLFDVSTTPGPNRLAESPEMAALLTSVPRLGSLTHDLIHLLDRLSGVRDQWEFKREKISGSDLPSSTMPLGKVSSSHVVRLWALDEVMRLVQAQKIPAAIDLAAQHQLVTSVSGAVVLENAQQFERAGLSPVDSASVPTVPEPGVVTLLVVGFLLAWFLKLRRRIPRSGVRS